MKYFPDTDYARLSDLLSKKKAALEIFFDLTQKQEAILATADDIKALDTNVGERSKVIEEIDGLHQELDGLLQSYNTFFAGAGSDENDPKRKAVQDILEATQSLMKEISKQDEINRAKAKKHLDDMSSEIKKLSLERKGLGVYHSTVGYETSGYFDRKQ